ncbi:MAG: restriction endonuclease subunit S [Dehalococcoidia bacterium]|nr:MAG: restriction endonuclease subunit S [Dehalococcoidia bacterium]
MIAIDETQAINNTLPKDWRKKRLSEVCIINPLRPPTIGRRSSELTSFVPMSAVDEIRGVIAKYEKRPFSDIAKGYTYFGEGDVLFAKITPCMQNGKHAIASGLTDGIGFGSTEFHIMRHGCEITSEWIHYYIRQTRILSEAMSHFTGSVGQQRVPETFLANLYIPLPPLDEQKRIVSILNEQMAAVEKARLAAEARLTAARALPAVYLRTIFQNEEEEGWQRVRLGDVIQLINGKAYSAEELLPKGKYPVLRVGNLFTNEHWYYSDLELSPEKYCDNGDLLYAWSASFNPFIWSGSKAIYHYHIWKVLCNDRLLPKFAYLVLLVLTQEIKQKSHGLAMLHMTKETMGQFTLSIPSRTDQKHIVAIYGEQMAAVEKMIATCTMELDTINTLPAALLRQAFTGGI